jgi:hypothetical protein
MMSKKTSKSAKKKNSNNARSRQIKKERDNAYSFLNFSNSGGLGNGAFSGRSRTIDAPSASGRTLTTMVPEFLSSKGTCVIRHSEYLTDVTGSVAFASQYFSINPGLLGTFPWLSTVANSFERYRFKKLWFRYETLSPSSQTGKVFYVPNFNVDGESPTSKLEALTYELSCGSQPWIRFDLNIPSKYLSTYNEYFVRSGYIDHDLKTYDPLALIVCVEGSTTSTLGEVWIDYEVELINPLGTQSLIPFNLTNNNSYVWQGAGAGFYGPNDTILFSSPPAMTGGAFPVLLNGNTMTFTSDFYGLILVASEYVGPSSNASWYMPPLLTGSTGATDWSSNPVTGFDSHSDNPSLITSTSFWHMCYEMIIVKSGGTLTFTYSKNVSTFLSSCYIFLSPMWLTEQAPKFPTLKQKKSVLQLKNTKKPFEDV